MVNKEQRRVSGKRRQVTVNLDSVEANIVSESSEGDPSESWGGINLRPVSSIASNQRQHNSPADSKETSGKLQTYNTDSPLRKSSMNITNNSPEQTRKTSSPELVEKRKDSETDSSGNVTHLIAKCYDDSFTLLNESSWVSFDDSSKLLFNDDEFPTSLPQDLEVKWLRAKDMNPSHYQVSVFMDTISHENVT